jgi:hypothetical protein
MLWFCIVCGGSTAAASIIFIFFFLVLPFGWLCFCRYFLHSFHCFGSVICTWGFCLFIVCPGASFEACSSKVFSLTGAGWFLVVVVVLVFKTCGFLL